VKTQVWVLGLGQVISIVLSRHCVAQVVPDQTLPVGERSQVSGDPNVQIDGGATRGTNLFHSFQQFSIPTGGSASFNNALNITNIITRVTGNNLSTIDGLIRANGTANLFLINPNGIVFGANARLAIGGSFLASTADRFVFNNGFGFSASDPQAPPLLTISAPIGLQYGNRSGEVRSQGAVLQAPNGQTLALAGGTVSVDGGQLLAPGGRVTLGGISEVGTVGLNLNGSLSVPDSIARADVLLTNGALVDVTAGGGGEIAIAARNLELSGGSGLRSGIGAGLGFAQAQAGAISIQATENVTLQESSIVSLVNSGGIGKGGDIVINAQSLFLTNSAVSVSTLGGAGGNLTVNTTHLIQLVGAVVADPKFGSGLNAQTGSRGDAGNVSIETRNLIVRDGAQIGSSTQGEGAGGNLTVKARDSIQLIERSADNQTSSGLFAQAGSRSAGKAGNVIIETGNLIVRDGAIVSSSALGQGAGGNLTIKATDSVQVIGRSAGGRSGGLFAQTQGRGAAGNVSIDTEDLIVGDGARVSLSTEGQGAGGNLSMNTRNLIIRDGAQIGSGAFGEGGGGSLTVKATDSIQLIGTSANNRFSSGLFAQTEGRGNAGNVSIETGTLIARNGAVVSAGTFGEGAGGNLTLKATDSVQVIGRSANNRSSSGLFAQAGSPSDGNAGNVSIETRNLIVRNGAQVSTSTLDSGAGGNLTVNAADSIQVVGTSADGQFPSRLTAQTSASGNAGNMTLKTRQFSIEDGAEVSSQQIISTATGNVGNIRIESESLSVGNNASLTVEDRSTIVAPQRTASVGNINIQSNSVKVDRGRISADTASTDGGNIDLGVQNVLLLRNGGRISTNAGTEQSGGNGGNITFNGGFIVAVPRENSNISANAFTGRGGNIRITTQGLFGIEPRASTTTGLSSITASSQFGISGTITLNTLGVDPNRGAVALPGSVIDTADCE
jgi:filamentous hemagglutinin family protein